MRIRHKHLNYFFTHRVSFCTHNPRFNSCNKSISYPPRTKSLGTSNLRPFLSLQTDTKMAGGSQGQIMAGTQVYSRTIGCWQNADPGGWNLSFASLSHALIHRIRKWQADISRLLGRGWVLLGKLTSQVRAPGFKSPVPHRHPRISTIAMYRKQKVSLPFTDSVPSQRRGFQDVY